MSGEGLTSFGKMPKEAEGKGEERKKKVEKVTGKMKRARTMKNGKKTLTL